jgi:hypothetical protein
MMDRIVRISRRLVLANCFLPMGSCPIGRSGNPGYLQEYRPETDFGLFRGTLGESRVFQKISTIDLPSTVFFI